MIKSRPKRRWDLPGIKRHITQIQLGIAMGLLALSNDPLSVDPAVFRIAFTGEAPLQVKEKGAQLTLSYSVSEPTAYVPESFEVRYNFEEDLSPIQDEALKKAKEVHVYRLETEAAQALKVWQEKLKQHRAAGGDGKGSIAIGISQGCRNGALPQGPLYVGVYGKTQIKGDFFLLAPRFDLRDFSWQEAGKKRSIEDLPPCEI